MNERRFRNGIICYGTKRLLPVVAVLLLAGLAACSDKDMPEEGTGPDSPSKEELATSRLKILTDPSEMPMEVVNYGIGNRARAATPDFDEITKIDLSNAPVPSDEVVDMMDSQFQDYSPSGKEFVLKANQKKAVNLNLNNAEWYVAGELTLTGCWNQGTIYVLNGGTLNWPSSLTVDNGVKIYCYEGGKINLTDNSLTINAGAELAIDGDFQVTETFYMNGTLTVTGKLTTSNLQANQTAQIWVNDMELNQANIGGKIYVDGSLTANSFEMYENTQVRVGCKAEIMEYFYLTNNNKFWALNYINSPARTEMTSSAKLFVNGNGWLNLGELTITNATLASINVIGDDYSVVTATTLTVQETNNLENTFTGKMGLHYDKIVDNGDGNPLTFSSMVKVNENDDTKLGVTECRPAFNGESNNDPDSKLEFTPLASINLKDHTHPISATCIQFNEGGDKAYVSWHERGTGIHGCIEVVGIDKENDEVKLLAYAEDENNDYNHIFYDKEANRIITVGHNRHNAIIGEIPLINGTFEDNTKLKYATLKGNRQPGKADPEFYGGDGNCVIRNGQYIQVASHGGLHTLNATDFSRIGGENLTGAASTDGSCKHLSIQNGKVAELHLTKRDKNMESSPAELRWFRTSDYEWDKPNWITSDLTISPVDGKNTIALDGDNIYVCLGKGGVRKYALDGSWIYEFKIDGNSLANGLAVDDKYLYIAYGGNGLIVLDKDTMEELGRYRNEKGKSCNYVAVKGNLLYLAYGESGVDIVRMSEK